MNTQQEAKEVDAKSFASQVGRDKYWDELSIEEKIERIRKLTKCFIESIGNDVSRLDKRVNLLESKHDNHTHNESDIYYKRMTSPQDVVSDRPVSSLGQQDKNKFF